MRVISLVPSLTETLFALGLGPDEVVGRTPWCVEPAEGVAGVPIVGGTKTPKLKRIMELRPDLVCLDREENPRATYEELRREGVPCWVSDVTRAAEVPAMLADLGARIGHPARGCELAAEVEGALGEAAALREALGPGPVALPLIWHEPLMALGPSRYGGDVVAQAGLRVPDPESGTGYPRVTPDRIGELGVRLLLLTSEPHDFSLEEGAGIADAVAAAGHPRPEVRKVDGQALTWFGARSAAGIRWWLEFRRELAQRGR